MPRYFKYFPLEEYTLSNTSTSLDTVTNILAKFKFDDDFKNNTVVYYEYDISEGETPEILAYNIYGSSEKHWIILAINDIVNPLTEWPLDNGDLISVIDKKYSTSEYANSSTAFAGVNWAKTNIHSYYKIETQTELNTNKSYETMIQLDANTYANVVSSSETFTLANSNQIRIDISRKTKTYYDYENDLNDSKRTIKILKNDFVPTVEAEFKRVMSNV
jgi:hypothetical protein